MKDVEPQTFQKVKEAPNKNCGSFVPHLLYQKQESKQLKRYSQGRFVVSRHFQKKARHAVIHFFCIAKFIIYRVKICKIQFSSFKLETIMTASSLQPSTQSMLHLYDALPNPSEDSVSKTSCFSTHVGVCDKVPRGRS